MVAGLKFLSKKSFNPQNLSNQERVYLREQQSQQEEVRLKARERQLTIERDAEELARARDGDSGGKKASLRFMYDVPPGLSDSKRDIPTEITDLTKTDNTISFEKMAGDDDAAAAFRKMLAAGSSSTTHHHDDSISDEHLCKKDDSTSLIISGSTAEVNSTDVKTELSELEKAVGKRNSNAALTYEEQIARFPQLRNAPVAVKRRHGEVSEMSNFTFKPLGAQIRNVRCLACKVWGHSKGDRECAVTGWNPFSISSVHAKEQTISSSNSSEKRNSSKIKPDSDDRNELESRKRKKQKDDRKGATREQKMHKHQKRDRGHRSDRYSNSDYSSGEERKYRKNEKRKSEKHRRRSRSRSFSDDSYSSTSR